MVPAFIWAWYTLSITLKFEATEKLCNKHHQNGSQPRLLPPQRYRENQLPNEVLSLPPALLKNRSCRISLWISMRHSSPFCGLRNQRPFFQRALLGFPSVLMSSAATSMQQSPQIYISIQPSLPLPASWILIEECLVLKFVYFDPFHCIFL